MNSFQLPVKFEGIPYCKKDDSFKFLLVKRIPEDGGFWQPITGTLESNESLIDCIYREFEEEINIGRDKIVGITEMFYQFIWDKKDVRISEYVFGVELSDVFDINLGDEHDDYKWCSFEEVLGFLEKENNKKAYAEFKKIFLDNF